MPGGGRIMPVQRRHHGSTKCRGVQQATITMAQQKLQLAVKARPTCLWEAIRWRDPGWQTDSNSWRPRHAWRHPRHRLPNERHSRRTIILRIHFQFQPTARRQSEIDQCCSRSQVTKQYIGRYHHVGSAQTPAQCSGDSPLHCRRRRNVPPNLGVPREDSWPLLVCVYPQSLEQTSQTELHAQWA